MKKNIYFLKQLKKHGGLKLIINFLKSGCLFTAINQFIVLGKSRTSLEILRLSTQLKKKRKLQKKYRKVLVSFDKNFNLDMKCVKSDKVWVCWFQGIENAPFIVKKCYESLVKNLNDKEVILITEKNIFDYVTFPDYIISKWKKGIITNTHMTDLLRLELLTKYGGTWIDSTVLCTANVYDIPDYYFNSELFFFQCLKPGRDGHSTIISSWYMNSKSNNRILLATKALCYDYWKNNNYMIDYFLLHFFLSIVLEYYEEDYKKIVPVDNSSSHILLLRLFDKYDKNMWDNIKNQVPFHKLTYKFEKQNELIEETYYKKIFD